MEHRDIRLRSSHPSPWTNLPKELLAMILKRLAFIDIVSVKSVCSNWNIAVRSYIYAPLPQTPCLMFPKGWSAKDKSPDFFSLAENKFYSITIDRPYNDYRYEVVGSSYGWLVIFTVPGYPYIINPFTSSCIIQLPKMIKSKDKKKRQLLSISKAIIPSDFYSSSFWVAVIYGPHRKHLGFLKHTHNTWTHLGGASEIYIDIIFYNGMLYALRNGGAIEVWDFLSTSPKKVMDLEFSPAVPQLVTYTKAFLVESMGKLLFVLRLTGGESPNSIDQFVVYQLDCGGERWITVETLSNQAFFVSKNQCVSVYAQDLPQVEENSIYFLTTDYTTFGIYNLKERRMINNTYAINNSEKSTRAPFWFVPNPHWMAHNVDQLPIGVRRREVSRIRQKTQNFSKDMLYCECCLSGFGTLSTLNELRLRVCVDCLKLLRSLNGFVGVKYPLTTLPERNATWMLFKYKYLREDKEKKLLELAQYYKHARSIIYVFLDDGSFNKFLRNDENLFSHMIMNASSGSDKDSYVSVYAPCVMVKERVVSSCTLRVYSQEMAFIAFVATLSDYRRRGFCKALIGYVEVMLRESGIKVILISAPSSTAESMWRSFGYTDMKVGEKTDMTIRYHLDVFSITLLHKKL